MKKVEKPKSVFLKVNNIKHVVKTTFKQEKNNGKKIKR